MLLDCCKYGTFFFQNNEGEAGDDILEERGGGERERDGREHSANRCLRFAQGSERRSVDCYGRETEEHRYVDG